jgi:hypothetical protein
VKRLRVLLIAFLLFFVPGVKTQDKSPRAYFDELKSAGAFAVNITSDKGEKISVPDQGYVCFSENYPMADRTGLFLTFEAMAYDKDYNDAVTIFINLNTSPDDRKKAWTRMENIQNRQPYVAFLTEELMSSMPAKAVDFFRKGGEELDLNLYMGGVKDWTAALQRSRETDKWKSENGRMDFAVESSTMRFTWFVHGDKPQVVNGRCEKIFKDKT